MALALALKIVGDRWTLMILSSSLSKVYRFNEFERALGINRNLLSSRLDKLIRAGLMEKRKYQEKPARYEYLITDVGKELRPVLVGLAIWSEKHLAKDIPVISMVHENCGTKAEIYVYCDACERVITNEEISPNLIPAQNFESTAAE